MFKLFTEKPIRACIFLIIGCVFCTFGCDMFPSMDGKTQSTITGEYSTADEIEAAARAQEAELLEQAAGLEAQGVQLQLKHDALAKAYESEMGKIAGENQRWSDFKTRGLGITKTLIDSFAPVGVKPIADTFFPLISDLLLLGGLGAGVGVAANKRGQRTGAAVVADGVNQAAEADPAFREAIKSGPAGDKLTKVFQKAPAPVLKAIAQNEVV